MNSETIFIIFACMVIIGVILFVGSAMTGNKLLYLFGIILMLSSIIFLIIMGNFQASHKPAKPIHSFLARNLEDMQLDTVYTYNLYPSSEVWVNMDSLWINSYRSHDLYATKYSIIRQIK